jgi:hypothetical protein
MTRNTCLNQTSGPGFTNYDLNKIIEMKKKGFVAQEIAKEFGVEVWVIELITTLMTQ